MNLYEGIYKRKTIRRFLPDKIDPLLLEYILNFTSHLEMLDESQQVQFEIVESKDERAFPYFLVISALPVEGYELNVGFLMQQIMLYLLTKGIGSCFLKYHKLPIHEIPGFKPTIMIAFGKTNQNLTHDSKKINRLPLSDLCTFKDPENEDMKKILHAARVAPSHYNSQPWRFVVYENRVHLFCKKSKHLMEPSLTLKKIDVGCALANMFLAAEELWYFSEIKKISNISEHSFKNNEYLVSILFQK